MTATIIESTTFEEVVSNEEWEPACECFWHEEKRGPAEWIVHQEAWCCHPPSVKLWCNDCLQEIMQFDGEVHCSKCRKWTPGYRPKHSITSVEPLYKDAA